MNALLNYPGAKWGMAKEIVALMPPHRSYLEPNHPEGLQPKFRPTYSGAMVQFRRLADKFV